MCVRICFEEEQAILCIEGIKTTEAIRVMIIICTTDRRDLLIIEKEINSFIHDE